MKFIQVSGGVSKASIAWALLGKARSACPRSLESEALLLGSEADEIQVELRFGHDSEHATLTVKAP